MGWNQHFMLAHYKQLGGIYMKFKDKFLKYLPMSAC